MAGLARRRASFGGDSFYWPGFVDAMAQLLLVITFLLSVFMIAQFMLAREITGRDTVLSELRSQIAELSELLIEGHVLEQVLYPRVDRLCSVQIDFRHLSRCSCISFWISLKSTRRKIPSASAVRRSPARQVARMVRRRPSSL